MKNSVSKVTDYFELLRVGFSQTFTNRTTANLTYVKKNSGLIVSALLVQGLIISAFVVFFQKEPLSPVIGTYRISSNDPMIQRAVYNQDIYLKVDKNNTIAYNTTINGKRKFDFSGTYVLDEKTNTLTIAWLGGNLPGQLKVEQEGEDYIIRIGHTTYKKEKS